MNNYIAVGIFNRNFFNTIFMKSALFVLLFIPFFAFCQVYEFDYCLTYQINKIKPEIEKWGNKTVFLNTKDRSYIMYSYDFSHEQTKWIVDFSVQMSYKFLIKKSKDSTELYYYDYARKFIKENSVNDIRKVEVNRQDDFSYIDNFRKFFYSISVSRRLLHCLF